MQKRVPFHIQDSLETVHLQAVRQIPLIVMAFFFEGTSLRPAVDNAGDS